MYWSGSKKCKPKVIETPNISTVAKNGIEVIVRLGCTVRANIDRLVGGSGEETIIARVERNCNYCW